MVYTKLLIHDLVLALYLLYDLMKWGEQLSHLPTNLVVEIVINLQEFSFCKTFSFWYIISRRDRKDTFIDGLRTPIYETAREF